MQTDPLDGNYTVSSLIELQAFASNLAHKLAPGHIILLSGNLGAGKTTFTQFLGKALGVVDSITSPTYTLVGEYSIQGTGAIQEFIHIDLYRTQGGPAPAVLNSNYIQEIIESAKARKAVVIIEWGELLATQLLSGKTVWHIAIGHDAAHQVRVLSVRTSHA